MKSNWWRRLLQPMSQPLRTCWLSLRRSIGHRPKQPLPRTPEAQTAKTSKPEASHTEQPTEVVECSAKLPAGGCVASSRRGKSESLGHCPSTFVGECHEAWKVDG